MNVCMSSMNSKTTGPIIMKIGIYIYVFFHGEGLYDMLIDATRHQVALQSSNFCPVQLIVIKMSMTMYFYTEETNMTCS